ncbi:hemerythrin domain-containing protein [Sulfuriferula sp. GW1]|uniref:hemerythrin domain-containing protein n=1 Tax=Sulfuriferula sp. GW1 TaxID=3345111 RepID=UPI0039B11C58
MQLMPKPAPGFDDPLGLLRACHERILGHCDTLERLVSHLRQHGADQDAQLAAARILRYFQVGAPLHHEDEERDLFPALRAHSAFPAIQHRTLENLMAQHRELDKLWIQLEAALQSISAGAPADLTAQSYVALTRAHIAVEEREIFPLAERYLDAAALIALSHAMRARRQT